MDTSKRTLDDVALRPPARTLDLSLNEVGLENVEMQVTVGGQRVPARGAASVSLVDRQSRGIHMSRLFQILTEFHTNELEWTSLTRALDQMLVSQGALSDAAYFEVSLDLSVQRRALISDRIGWRNYPVTYRVERVRGELKAQLTVWVLYSSTCPCSASLSRQALQDLFKTEAVGDEISADRVLEWLGTTSAATPHSQRSEAICTLTLAPGTRVTALDIIDRVEAALGTPVQTAVKRADEQEFARLNARNLMFCEDAARKLKAAFESREDVVDYDLTVKHFESLHPHDVIARARKFD